jgi:hypothetical protein
MMFARIMEYRASWNINDGSQGRLRLFSFKIIVFRDKYPALENHLSPNFNEFNEIDGTQWNINGLNIKLDKFKETDYMFHTDVASTGYKKYYREGDLTNSHSIVFESKLSMKI